MNLPLNNRMASKKHNEWETISCPICNSRKYEVLSHKGAEGIFINVSLCKECGLLYLNPRWTKKEYADFYKEEYDSHHRKATKEEDCIKYRYIRPIARWLNENGYLSGIKNVLDIGSGMGWSLKYLKDNYFGDGCFYAIEPSIKCRENLKKLKITLVTDDIDKEWDCEKMDLVIMRHTLEHFLYPAKSLRKISNILSDKGILYIAVPNALKPTTPVTKTSFRVAHTFYYSIPTLKNLLSLSGLEEEQIFDQNIEVDGEVFNEIIAVCKKAKESKKRQIKKEAYIFQRRITFSHVAAENRPYFRLKYFLIEKVINKAGAALVPLFKKMGIYALSLKIYKRILK